MPVLPAALARAPQVFHLCRASAWEDIRRDGLLSVERLVRRAGLPDDEAARILATRRPRGMTLPDGRTWLRDQGPLREGVLARMLDDMTVAQYLRRLNGLVFLWAEPERLERLRRLPRYADEPQLVLTVDTASLVAAHGDHMVVTRINSGATVAPAGRRGTHTFRPLADAEPGQRIAEVAVEDAIPDIARHVVDVAPA